MGFKIKNGQSNISRFDSKSTMENCANLKDRINTWNVETKECGIWETFDTTTTEIEAYRLASQLILDTREDWIRVVDPENKIT